MGGPAWSAAMSFWTCWTDDFLHKINLIKILDTKKKAYFGLLACLLQQIRWWEQRPGIWVFDEINHPCVPCESGCVPAGNFIAHLFKIANYIEFHVSLSIHYYNNIYSGTGSGIPLYLGLFEACLSGKVVETISDLSLFCWSSIIAINPSLSDFPSSTHEYILLQYPEAALLFVNKYFYKQLSRNFRKYTTIEYLTPCGMHLNLILTG